MLPLSDENECENGKSCCNHNCINNRGGHTCSCSPGYQLDEDGCNCYGKTLNWSITYWPITAVITRPKVWQKSDINFGWTKKNLLERDLNLWPLDWCASTLPTELTSPILEVSLFCQHLCSGGGGGITPKLRYNLGRGSKRMHHKGIQLFFCKYHELNHKGNWLGTYFRNILDAQRKIY